MTAEAIALVLHEALPLCTDDGKDQVAPAPPEPGTAASSDGRLDTTYPVSFGYKMTWLAIHSSDTSAVVAALGLRAVRAVGWAGGIDAAYGDGPIGAHGVFVTPTVNGWTLVVGALPDAYAPEWLPFLAELSRVCGEVQYFGTHRGVNYQAWARAVDGQVLRAYANGEGGFLDLGPKTAEEVVLGFDFLGEAATAEDYAAYDERDQDPSPDEEHVVKLAGAWSIDPTQLDREESLGFGVVGELPSAD